GVLGPADREPSSMPLKDDSAELPMILSLEGRRPQLGSAGANIARQAPHLTCFDFLASLGEEREWKAGRHRLDSAKALAIVFEEIREVWGRADGIGVATRGYWTRPRAALLGLLAGRAKLRGAGSIASPLANGLAAFSPKPGTGPAILIDV